MNFYYSNSIYNPSQQYININSHSQTVSPWPRNGGERMRPIQSMSTNRKQGHSKSIRINTGEGWKTQFYLRGGPRRIRFEMAVDSSILSVLFRLVKDHLRKRRRSTTWPHERPSYSDHWSEGTLDSRWSDDRFRWGLLSAGCFCCRWRTGPLKMVRKNFNFFFVTSYLSREKCSYPITVSSGRNLTVERNIHSK